jgi:hypothetical protein
MKFNLLGLLAGLTFFSSTVSATEYIYRDLMANTLPSPVCAAESEAIARITNQLPINEKVAKADVVLDNNAPELDKLYQQIDKTLFPLGL